MNFAQIVDTAIAKSIALTDTAQIININRAFVGAMVNEGYHVIERAAVWQWSEAEATLTAVVGDREPTGYPTDLATIISVWDNTAKIEVGYHDERQKDLDWSVTNAPPQCYSLWSGEFRLWPKPDDTRTYTLKYYKYWTDLSLDTDEPVIPDAFHSLLADYAAGHLTLRIPPTGDRFLPTSKAQPYFENFNRGLIEMLNGPHCVKTLDETLLHDFNDYVVTSEDW